MPVELDLEVIGRGFSQLETLSGENDRIHHASHYPPVGGDMSACRFGLFAEDAAEGFFELGCCAFDVRLICV